MYEMTKKGLAELAMSFTGEKARVVRIRFIAAFNATAEQLHRRDLGLWQGMRHLIAREAESRSAPVRLARYGYVALRSRACRRTKAALSNLYAAFTS
jgi:phage regulator Rha-like protein